MRRFAAGLFCLLAVAVTAAAQSSASWPKAWNLAHPNATALIGIDVRGIRQSAIGQSIGEQVKSALPALPAMALSKAPGGAPLPGKEFLDDIDRILISSPGLKTPPAKASAARTPAAKPPAAGAGAKENPPFLMIVTGHFPAEHLQAFLKGQPRVQDTVDVYSPDPSGKSSLARVDENTLLFGDSASVRSAIERRNSPPASPSPLLARGSAMAADNHFWIVSSVSPSAFQPSNMSLGALAADVTGLELGLAFRDGLTFQLNLATKTPEAAARMAQMVTAQLQLAMAAKTGNQQTADMLRRIQITTDGNRVGFHTEATREEVERGLRQMQQSLLSGAAAGAKLAPPARPAPPPPPAGTIRIYGEPGGTREIPAGPPPQ
ncbi:MAG: hypothetical protein ACLQBJ_03255 [Bryobacteraceae bacterium]